MAKAATKKTESLRVITRQVLLRGLADVMFDRYAGDNKTQLRPDQKLYLGPDGETVGLPAMNLMSFLSSQNTMSAPKRLLDSRSYRKVASGCLSYVTISPQFIPVLRNGKPIKFHGFDGDEDKEGGIYIHYSVARLKDGVPNPKVRPVVRCPWEVEFTIQMFPNPDVTEEQLQNLFISGGMALGLGTFRGVFGKFAVEKWE